MTPSLYQSTPRPLAWLTPDPANPNTHPPESIAAIVASIHAFGFDQPILATRDGMIIAGHGRYIAAQQLGLTTVPVVITDLSGIDAVRRNIADNRTAELSVRDPETLATLLEQIRADDPMLLAGTGYDDAAIDTLLADIAAAAGVDDSVQVEPRAQDSTKEQWLIVVTCSDESTQTDLYTHLSAEGHECRLLVS